MPTKTPKRTVVYLDVCEDPRHAEEITRRGAVPQLVDGFGLSGITWCVICKEEIK
ncbi:hypothetical protein ACFVH6_25550 [Spirillospora sp. NPDC127200]